MLASSLLLAHQLENISVHVDVAVDVVHLQSRLSQPCLANQAFQFQDHRPLSSLWNPLGYAKLPRSIFNLALWVHRPCIYAA